MPRQPRSEHAGAFYHVISRGDRDGMIYHDNADRETWLKVVRAVCKRHGWHVYAYCQMGNHYHLLVQMFEPSLSQGMRALNGAYSWRFNQRHGGRGPVFQNGFQSEMVHRQLPLLERLRDVVLNPVRAGMVATPGSWPWSSYALTCDAVRAPAWLETDWVIEQFGDNHADAVRAFRRFVAEGCENGHRRQAAIPGVARAVGADTAGSAQEGNCCLSPGLRY